MDTIDRLMCILIALFLSFAAFACSIKYTDTKLCEAGGQHVYVDGKCINKDAVKP